MILIRYYGKFRIVLILYRVMLVLIVASYVFDSELS